LPINMARDTTVNVGGPFVRDRLWWFASYRRYDINESVLSVRRRTGGNVADINHQTDGVGRLDYGLYIAGAVGDVSDPQPRDRLAARLLASALPARLPADRKADRPFRSGPDALYADGGRAEQFLEPRAALASGLDRFLL